MKYEYTPIHDRILVRQDGAVKKTAGGLFIPEAMQGKPTHGTVIAIGDAVKHLAVGDRVAFTMYAPQAITLEGEEFCVMRENDVSLRMRVRETAPIPPTSLPPADSGK